MLRRQPDPWVRDLARIDELGPVGAPRRTARRRVAAKTWQQPLPGVVCRTTGALTREQWQIAALKYAGPGAVLSHASAGEFWGLGRWLGPVHVTVPHGHRVRSTPEVVIHQSRRPTEERVIDDVVLTAPARTAIDLALSLVRQADVDAVLGRAIQSGRVTAESLGDELDQAPRRGSRRARVALADAAAGFHAASEARLLRLVRRAGLPLPDLNAPVHTTLGTRYVDALWRALRKGVEVDGAGYHFTVGAWESDLRRQNALQTAGVVLLRIAARRLWTEPDAVVAEIAAFLAA